MEAMGWGRWDEKNRDGGSGMEGAGIGVMGWDDGVWGTGMGAMGWGQWDVRRRDGGSDVGGIGEGTGGNGIAELRDVLSWKEPTQIIRFNSSYYNWGTLLLAAFVTSR